MKRAILRTYMHTTTQWTNCLLSCRTFSCIFSFCACLLFCFPFLSFVILTVFHSYDFVRMPSLCGLYCGRNQIRAIPKVQVLTVCARVILIELRCAGWGWN
jgi:hypothetical protein